MLKIKNDNLVIAAVGDESLHHHWSPMQEFDLYLIYYGDDENFGYSPATLTERQKGAKYNLFADAIEDHPEILNYKYVWMPDDDIYLRGTDISKLFRMAKKYGLWICQPSLMGWYGLKITLHQHECLLRYTNYVEIMCPCFSSSALKTCMTTFRENKTGWGIDHVWNKLLNHPTDRIAIIDDIVAVHTRPIGGGDMYKNQADNKMDQASKEYMEIYKKHKMGASSYSDLTKGKIVSSECFHRSYYNLVEYGRIHRQEEAGRGLQQRFWPPSPEIRKLCKKLREER